jgi:hypothetical protein
MLDEIVGGRNATVDLQRRLEAGLSELNRAIQPAVRDLAAMERRVAALEQAITAVDDLSRQRFDALWVRLLGDDSPPEVRAAD